MVSQNLYRGGTPPFGYKLILNGRYSDRDKKQRTELYDMVTDLAEASIVRLIFRLASDYGWGAKRIAAYLDKEGYKGRSDNYITPRYVASLISKPIYKGYLTYGRSSSKKSVLKKTGNVKSVKMPDSHVVQATTYNPEWAIVSEEIWDHVNADREARQDKKLATELLAPHKSQLLLAGFCVCGYCGRKFKTQNKTTYTATGKKYSYLYYDCVGRINRMPDCPLNSAYAQKLIEEPVVEMVRQYLKDFKSDRKNNTINRITENQALLMSELNKTSKIIEKIEKGLEVLNEEIFKAILGESSFSKAKVAELIEVKEQELAEHKKKKKLYERKLKSLNSDLSRVTELGNELVAWVDIFDQGNMDMKKSILHKLIDVVAVTKEEIDIKFKFSMDEK